VKSKIGPIYTTPKTDIPMGHWLTGDELKEARERACLTQNDLAQLTDINYAIIQNLEDGHTLHTNGPTQRTIQAALERALQATPHDNMPPCCYAPPDAPLAHLMYAAYNAAGEKKGLTWDGKPCPIWDALTDDVRAKWEAAAGEAEAYWKIALDAKERGIKDLVADVDRLHSMAHRYKDKATAGPTYNIDVAHFHGGRITGARADRMVIDDPIGEMDWPRSQDLKDLKEWCRALKIHMDDDPPTTTKRVIKVELDTQEARDELKRLNLDAAETLRVMREAVAAQIDSAAKDAMDKYRSLEVKTVTPDEMDAAEEKARPTVEMHVDTSTEPGFAAAALVDSDGTVVGSCCPICSEYQDECDCADYSDSHDDIGDGHADDDRDSLDDALDDWIGNTDCSTPPPDPPPVKVVCSTCYWGQDGAPDPNRKECNDGTPFSDCWKEMIPF